MTTPAPQELPRIISVDDHIVEPRELWWRGNAVRCYGLDRFGITA